MKTALALTVIVHTIITYVMMYRLAEILQTLREIVP